jgi:hypothetical protein
MRMFGSRISVTRRNTRPSSSSRTCVDDTPCDVSSQVTFGRAFIAEENWPPLNVEWSTATWNGSITFS